MTSNVRISVVGCGYWGPNLIRNLTEIPGVQLVSCCDPRTARLEYIRQRYPFIATTCKFDDVLDDPSIDAVCIATPVSTHHILARAALTRGKHVLVEKPLASSTSQAEDLVGLARKNRRVLMVGHTFEYTGAVRKIRELVAGGELGEVFYLDSVRVNLGLFQNDVNVVWDLAVHDISIMLHILDQEPVGVRAHGASFVSPIGVEDAAYLTLAFPGKTFANVHVSWLAPAKFRRMTVVGSKKMVAYDDIENIEKVKVFDKGVSIEGDPASLLERQLHYRSGDVWSPKLDTTEPLQNECRHFIDCIRTGAVPVSDGISGLRVVRVLEAAQKSLAQGGRNQELWIE